MSTDPDDDFPSGTLALTASLFRELNAREIAYCHWKSTPSLPRALAGGTDLDLLVDRRDADRFALTLAELGFKPFVSHPSRRFPGVEDQLGFDEPSGRLVHLHLYYQLILGAQYVKGHRFPLERAFLESSTVSGGVRVPPPALELTVLILRLLLKYRDADAVKDVLQLGRRGGLPPDALAEVAALRVQVDERLLRQTAVCYLPSVPPDLFIRFLAAIETNPRDALVLVALRRRARRALRRYERFGGWEARRRYLGARLAHWGPLRPVLHGLTRSELRRKSPLAGGLTVAILGPDGAGKTTVVGALRDWLAWRLNLRVLYLGSAQPSRLTRALKIGSKGLGTADRVLARFRRNRGRRSVLTPVVELMTGLRYLGDAADRAGRVAEGRRLAAQGAVVVFDRFPLRGVTIGDRPMDGPRIRQLGDRSEQGLLGLLRRREEAIYRRIAPPDHVVLLRLDAEAALSRKPSRSPEQVAAKSRAVADADLERQGISVTAVDASQPLDDVVRQVKAELWRRL